MFVNTDNVLGILFHTGLSYVNVLLWDSVSMRVVNGLGPL